MDRSSTRSLPELAYSIQFRCSRIYDILAENDIPQLSSGLLESLDELRALVLGPPDYLFFLLFLGPARTATLNVLYKFRIAQHLKEDEAVSFKDLGDRCGLTETATKRYVRAAIALRIFEERPEGFVRHNGNSLALSEELLHDFTGFATEDLGPSAMKAAEVMAQHPDCDDPKLSPFAVANGSRGDRDLFAILSQQPARLRRFANAMSYSLKAPNMSPSLLVSHVPWAGGPEAAPCPKVVVDVGGSRGGLCEALVAKYPGIERAVTQDLPEVTEQSRATTAAAAADDDDARRKLEYQSYDFFTEQPLRGADVYIFRCVFHDWPDRLAVQILRNQTPALKRGARLLINERCLEAPRGLDHVDNQFAMACDLYMQLGANAKERSRDDWAALLAEADGRFKLVSIVSPKNSALSIIEVAWTGGAEVDG
ncbi:S-adenosyl-L-methionine-dependent methyltransferase [Xylariomycetidae sp. FL0641]|nr:S-adenosyl-L-methionine-dependent methyltransferase [Xylariomycetidae sp. FL0641]